MSERTDGDPMKGSSQWPCAILGEIFRRLPFRLTNTLTVLGLTLHCGLSFREQLKNTLDKANVRLAILARAAGSTWGRETSVLRLTHDATLGTFLRYGIALLGSGLCGKHFMASESRITNVAARRIAGVGRSARSVILYVTAGVSSAHDFWC